MQPSQPFFFYITHEIRLFLFLIPFSIQAQKPSPDTLNIAKELAPVTVLSSRILQKENQLPVSVTTLGKARLQIGQTKLSLFDALNTVPGVLP
jgi:hypothetical protein